MCMGRKAVNLGWVRKWRRGVDGVAPVENNLADESVRQVFVLGAAGIYSYLRAVMGASVAALSAG